MAYLYYCCCYDTAVNDDDDHNGDDNYEDYDGDVISVIIKKLPSLIQWHRM